MIKRDEIKASSCLAQARQDETPLEARDVIERLCKLQFEVFRATATNLRESADCFCGRGGFWDVRDYDGTVEHGYRNDGLALKFIEDAVREKIANLPKPVPINLGEKYICTVDDNDNVTLCKDGVEIYKSQVPGIHQKVVTGDHAGISIGYDRASGEVKEVTAVSRSDR